MKKVVHVHLGGVPGGGVGGYIEKFMSFNSQNGFSYYLVTLSVVNDSSSKENVSDRSILLKKRKFVFFKMLYNIIKLSPSIVHAHTLKGFYYSYLPGLISKAPIVYTNHGIRYAQKNGVFVRFIFFCLEIVAIKLASHTVCVRKSDVSKLRGFHLVQDSEISLINTRLDIL